MATARKSVGPGTDENVVNLDFTKLEPRGTGFGPAAHVPDGDYLLQLLSGKNVEKKNKPSERQISAAWRIVGTPDYDEAKKGLGGTIYSNLQVMPNSDGLWFTRNVIEDLTGKSVTGKAFALTLADKVGMVMGATLAERSYINAKSEDVTSSEVRYSFPADRFVGYSPEHVATKAPSARAAVNGAASPQEAAEAVSDTSDEEEDIPIAELENI